MRKQMTVKVTQEDGSLWAEVSEFPGLFAAGDTLDELVESLREGLELYLSEADGPKATVTIIATDELSAPPLARGASVATSVEYACV